MTNRQRIDEMLKNGEVIFESHSQYFNTYTNRWLTDNLYHIECDGEIWRVETITGAKGGYVDGYIPFNITDKYRKIGGEWVYRK